MRRGDAVIEAQHPFDDVPATATPAPLKVRDVVLDPVFEPAASTGWCASIACNASIPLVATPR
jgi:hypothetical protein